MQIFITVVIRPQHSINDRQTWECTILYLPNMTRKLYWARNGKEYAAFGPTELGFELLLLFRELNIGWNFLTFSSAKPNEPLKQEGRQEFLAKAFYWIYHDDARGGTSERDRDRSIAVTHSNMFHHEAYSSSWFASIQSIWPLLPVIRILF
jgi:hypothetical protein